MGYACSPLMVLVDDDPALLSAMSFAFETEGYHVAAYGDAESFLARPPGPASCFVLDVNLPGLSGLALLERLRLMGEKAPAVMITTHPSAVMKVRARAAKAEILEKPLVGDALLRKVDELVPRQI
jgi:FixJ family two-component response regulator